MIVDKIENADQYTVLSAGIKAGLEYIKSTDLSSLAPGSHDLPDGMKAIIAEYTTKDIADARPEAHEKFIDIQYIISGVEQIGYAPLKGQTPSVPYNADADLVFYNAETSLNTLEAGMFAIYWPTDIHQPGIRVDKAVSVKKLVLKIPV